MNQNFDDILNDCLERIAAGEDIPACVERYPEHSEELASLLRIAKVTMQVAVEATQIDDAKARVLARVNQRLAEAKSGSRWYDGARAGLTRFVPSFATGLAARPVIVGFAAVFLVVVAAGGSALASANSVPGEPLYWVKTTREAVSLQIPRSDEGQAKVHARLAGIRGQELQVLVSRGRLYDAERVALRMRYHLNLSAGHVGILLSGDPTQMTPRPVQVRRMTSAVALRQVLERDESIVKAHLTALLSDVTPTHQVRLRRIIYQTDYGYRILIQAIDERNSFVPGQLLSAVPVRLPAQ